MSTTFVNDIAWLQDIVHVTLKISMTSIAKE